MTMTFKEYIDLLCDRVGFRGSAWGPKIITPFLHDIQECQILLAMPGTLDELAEKTGFSLDFVKEKVEWLDTCGLCLDRDRERGKVYEYHTRTVSMEDTMTYHLAYSKDDRITKKMVDDFFYGFDVWANTDHSQDLLDDLKKVQSAGASKDKNKAALWRVIPLPGTVKDGTKLDPIEDYEMIIRNAPAQIIINECACNWVRHHQSGLAGKDLLGKDNEVCIHLSPYGENKHLIERGLGRLLTTEEALAKCREFAERGLVMTANGGKPLVGQICNCDSRGCSMSRARWKKDMKLCQESRFKPQLDDDKCISCGACLKRCPYGFITMVKDMEAFDNGLIKAKMVINMEKCVGCGACVPKCPTDAIGLRVVHDLDWLIEAPTRTALDDIELVNRGFTPIAAS